MSGLDVHATGRPTASAACEASLEAIARVEDLNAVLTVTADRARERATALDALSDDVAKEALR